MEYISKFACQDSEAKYLKEENIGLYKTPFYSDCDKIVRCNAYSRYRDKSQVYSQELVDNDHTTSRIIHVELVSRIAKLIGRNLGLNEDLIEAASKGHDIGHAPFAHEGERAITKVSLKLNEGYFNHNVHSLRTLMELENHGLGLNISLQVLDAILCHNGEAVHNRYVPNESKSFNDLIREYQACYQDKEMLKKLHSMSLEGCVLRISDVISYIGRDIDDALRNGQFKWDDIPRDITNYLGHSTEEIENNIISDIIDNSYGKPYIELGTTVSDTLSELLKFNTANIYLKKCPSEFYRKLDFMFETLIMQYIEDIVTNNPNSVIVNTYLAGMPLEYHMNNTPARIAIDFVAGMTDRFLLDEFSNHMSLVRKK